MPLSTKDDPAGDEARMRYRSKAVSEYYDPCGEAAKRSIRCLHRNQNEKDLCSAYFEAYRDCKKRWLDDLKEQKMKARRGE
ncbi:cytochrome c oxidase-assembly factor cox-23, mitochondrial [Ascobolus immersus RN42]|uniref:Cytochrome c oxidase-assembly factor COX23, mitochondrial n=1 Tax=Ascobolus immersus RN42 TaxID=1160509 RepID=A0A3N4IBA4_ASCIM|nr:cytochrome c oxidase-assembly factor cox-23, mitochondrial [Ascobolus immersus RN42]